MESSGLLTRKTCFVYLSVKAQTLHLQIAASHEFHQDWISDERIRGRQVSLFIRRYVIGR